MSTADGIPRVAATAINDLLDDCIRVEAGQEILLLAHVDGLYGGDNVVDRDAIAWIQSGIAARGAHPAVLWIDEPMKPHAWRIPPAAIAAIRASDILILNSLDLELEETVEMKISPSRITCRTYAILPPRRPCSAPRGPGLPTSSSPRIRREASLAFVPGLAWEMWDELGTKMTGAVLPPGGDSKGAAAESTRTFFPTYAAWRHERGGYYRPWPEWVFPPISMADVNGTCVFDCMLSYWSRLIGISPYFSSSIKLTVENSRIVKIEGGEEAEALKRFLTKMQETLGDGVWRFDCLHGGVHPQASVSPYQCPSVLHRRMIEHAHTCNIHVHIGAPDWTPSYNYWMHLTGDLRTASLRVGDKLVWDKGHLTALDSPEVKAVAAKYPDRPGLEPEAQILVKARFRRMHFELQHHRRTRDREREEAMLAFTDAHVIDGTGSAPITAATVLVNGKTIAAAGRDVPVPDGATVIDLKGKTLLPGLMDNHSHFGDREDRPGLNNATESFNYAPLRDATLASGITTIRSCGDWHTDVVETRDMIERGLLRGPRMFCCGRQFGKRDGHPATTVWRNDPDSVANAGFYPRNPQRGQAMRS